MDVLRKAGDVALGNEKLNQTLAGVARVYFVNWGESKSYMKGHRSTLDDGIQNGRTSPPLTFYHVNNFNEQASSDSKVVIIKQIA